MAYSAEAVAKAFLRLAQLDNQSIDPLKIMKLVYFAHGLYLASADAPLIRETVKAWQWGPVIPALFQRFKKYGRIAIPSQESALIAESIPESDDWAHEVIKKTWEQFKNTSGYDLSLMTHAEGTPWTQVWDPKGGKTSNPIPNEMIKDYFLG